MVARPSGELPRPRAVPAPMRAKPVIPRFCAAWQQFPDGVFYPWKLLVIWSNVVEPARNISAGTAWKTSVIIEFPLNKKK